MAKAKKPAFKKPSLGSAVSAAFSVISENWMETEFPGMYG